MGIRIDAEHAPAWTLLGSAYANQALTKQAPFDEAYERASDAIETALAIDPNYANAVSARAWIAMSYQGDFKLAARFFRRAIELAPNDPVILGNMAVLTTKIGEVERALQLTEKSLALDPVSTVGHSNRADQLMSAGKSELAVTSARKAIELAPDNQTARVNLALAYLINDESEKALAANEHVDVMFYHEFVNSLAFHALGRTQESDQALALLTDQFGWM